MSLKAFHLVFITCSILLAFGFGGWLLKAFVQSGGWWPLAAGIASFAVGVGLVVYERYFLRKTRHISYL